MDYYYSLGLLLVMVVGVSGFLGLGAEGLVVVYLGSDLMSYTRALVSYLQTSKSLCFHYSV
jgi:hypothetical protein